MCIMRVLIALSDEIRDGINTQLEAIRKEIVRVMKGEGF